MGLTHPIPVPISAPIAPPRPERLLPFSAVGRSSRTSRPLALHVAATSPPAAELEQRKQQLLWAVHDTQRGLAATPDQRSAIEEALVLVEVYDAGSAVDLARLDGTWRLNYTSAADVLVLFEAAARLPFFQVGQIFQKFECQHRTNGGIVRNVVRWSIPTILEEQEGATLLVSAKFSVLSKRNIYLQFEEKAMMLFSVNKIRASYYYG